MPPKRNSGTMNGTASANNAQNGSVKSIKIIGLALIVLALYYQVNVKEKSFITSTQGVLGTVSEQVKVDLPAARFDLAHTKRKFVLDEENEFTPRIAWLMSFPNSGTSFTMTMVARSTNKAFATNYGDEVIAKDETDSLSIYPRRPEGPFWAGMSGKISTPRELPDTYVITKTHCGSRCMNCGPKDYVQSAKEFLRDCASGHSRVPPKRRRIDVEYDPARVAKAIHLIRNPLHNIIARYHLEHRHHEYSKDEEWLKKHSNDKEGLHKFCAESDKAYEQQDEKFYGEGKVPKAPCHGEFYKYTQWHNYVHEGLALIPHEVPVLTVYYEDYSNKFQETAEGILNFLELEQVSELREFSARSDYGDYFSKDQVKEIKKMMKRFASEKTWSQIKHYFDE